MLKRINWTQKINVSVIRLSVLIVHKLVKNKGQYNGTPGLIRFWSVISVYTIMAATVRLGSLHSVKNRLSKAIWKQSQSVVAIPLTTAEQQG